MEYRVRFAPDRLMGGEMWLICRKADVTTLYLAESAHDMTQAQKERYLEECWAGYRAMTVEVPVEVPAQRSRYMSSVSAAP